MRHKYCYFRLFFTLSLLVMGLFASAQQSAELVGLEPLAKHLAVFGRSLPQELTFVHTDNTCYYVGYHILQGLRQALHGQGEQS